MHKWDSEMWNIMVQDAINARTIVDEAIGCFRWIGERSRNWGYPIVRVETTTINVRQWNAPHYRKRRGHASFFRATCGTEGCIRIPHLELIEMVPVETVRAMEAQMRAERAAA